VLKVIILGIDPGYAIIGYGILKLEGNDFQILDYGSIETKAGTDFASRLKRIYLGMNELIEKFKPDAVAVEDLFFNKNTKTAMKVSHGRGVILLSGALNDIEVFEYTPLQVKQAVCGYGRADKNQVQQMVKMILGLSEVPKPDDTADALAVAICHGHSYNLNKLKDSGRR
jgi:crossover junction endodeoxyribonuclease RuvC